jgi:hypothetical protein
MRDVYIESKIKVAKKFEYSCSTEFNKICSMLFDMKHTEHDYKQYAP